jgi:tripartite-type tricarboxylate transporter receptor subunit TctC
MDLGHTVINNTKPGTSGQIGTVAIKAAPADGSTFLLALDHSVVVVPLIAPTAGLRRI